uniref:Uncharacterized protein n=1 Tax=Oryza rufipogon TaxID=4529 RepID=A0A0E0RBM1_ORYRU
MNIPLPLSQTLAASPRAAPPPLSLSPPLQAATGPRSIFPAGDDLSRAPSAALRHLLLSTLPLRRCSTMVETHRSTTTAASKYSSLSPSSSAAKQRRPRPQRAPVRARMRWRPREEEIAGGHSGGVNLPGTCSFLMAFSTALHSQWILLRSACALTPLQWSNRFGKKCQSVQATGLGLVLLEQRFFMHGQAADSNESKSSGRCKFFLTGRSTMMPLF